MDKNDYLQACYTFFKDEAAKKIAEDFAILEEIGKDLTDNCLPAGFPFDIDMSRVRGVVGEVTATINIQGLLPIFWEFGSKYWYFRDGLGQLQSTLNSTIEDLIGLNISLNVPEPTEFVFMPLLSTDVEIEAQYEEEQSPQEPLDPPGASVDQP